MGLINMKTFLIKLYYKVFFWKAKRLRKILDDTSYEVYRINQDVDRLKFKVEEIIFKAENRFKKNQVKLTPCCSICKYGFSGYEGETFCTYSIQASGKKVGEFDSYDGIEVGRFDLCNKFTKRG